MSSPDLVVRGLPYEATDEEIQNFFNLGAQEVRVSKWRDSGRCRGIAFLTLEGNQEEIARIQSHDGATFECDGNSRQVTITVYEEREPRQRKGRQNNNNRRQRQTRGNDRRENDSVQFEMNAEARREIYVSNIPYEATQEDFEEVFGQFGEVEDVTIPVVYTSGKPKGFAFVRFATEEARDGALACENELTMHDRVVSVRQNKGRSVRPQGNNRRQRQPRKEGLSEKPEDCRTIFVGNLPWSTEDRDLDTLFAGYGEIVNSRIVKQSWSGKSRGFGYVEFADTKAVDQAVKADINLEERKLRLDYANDLVRNDENEV